MRNTRESKLGKEFRLFGYSYGQESTNRIEKPKDSERLVWNFLRQCLRDYLREPRQIFL